MPRGLAAWYAGSTPAERGGGLGLWACAMYGIYGTGIPLCVMGSPWQTRDGFWLAGAFSCGHLDGVQWRPWPQSYLFLPDVCFCFHLHLSPHTASSRIIQEVFEYTLLVSFFVCEDIYCIVGINPVVDPSCSPICSAYMGFATEGREWDVPRLDYFWTSSVQLNAFK